MISKVRYSVLFSYAFRHQYYRCCILLTKPYGYTLNRIFENMIVGNQHERTFKGNTLVSRVWSGRLFTRLNRFRSLIYSFLLLLVFLPDIDFLGNNSENIEGNSDDLWGYYNGLDWEVKHPEK